MEDGGSATSSMNEEGAVSKRVAGVTVKDVGVLSSSAVVITTGTFLRGMIHLGVSRSEHFHGIIIVMAVA